MQNKHKKSVDCLDSILLLLLLLLLPLLSMCMLEFVYDCANLIKFLFRRCCIRYKSQLLWQILLLLLLFVLLLVKLFEPLICNIATVALNYAKIQMSFWKMCTHWCDMNNKRKKEHTQHRHRRRRWRSETIEIQSKNEEKRTSTNNIWCFIPIER